MLNIFGSFLLIIFVSALSFIIYDKVKIKDLYKQLIIGIIFGGVSIFCNWFTYKNIVSLSYSAVLVSGILFGGPAGAVAGLIGAAERFIFINENSLEILKLSTPVTLLISGMATFAIRKFVISEKRIKWYFGFVASAVIGMINVILVIVFNIYNVDNVYSVIKTYEIIGIVINSIVLGLDLLLFTFLPQSKFAKEKKNVGIQLKTQAIILVAILVGFISVSSIAYQVLRDNSDKTTISTMTKSLEDVEKNIVDDVNNDIAVLSKELVKFMKQRSLQREDYNEDNVPMGYESYNDFYQRQTEELQFIADSRDVTELSIIRQDGTVKYTTSDYLRSLSNISEFNISQFEIASDENVLVDSIKFKYNDYCYIDQIDKNMKYVYGQMTKNDDSLYILVGFDTDEYYSYIRNSVDKGLAKRHAGEKGFLIVSDNENNVISTPTSLIENAITIDLENKRNLSLFSLNSENYYSYIDEFGGLNFIVLMNKEECDRNMNSSLKTTFLTEIAIFAILYLIIYFAILFDVIKPLRNVNKSLNSITNGNLDKKVLEDSNQELSDLSTDINSMVESLKEYMGREARLIKKDLDFAKNIQLSALPKITKDFSNNPYFEMFATMNTAKEVGGDFYDFELLDDKHLFILIADVSGKGVPAALFMMQAKTTIKALVENSDQIGLAMTKANERLCENNSAGMFVTCWCAVINLETGVMEYVNAGHNPPLLKKNTQDFAYISDRPGFVLAGLDNFIYRSNKIVLEPGDQLFLYTDGVTEAYSINEELFGEDRLLKCAKSNLSYNPENFCNCVLANVKEFAKDKEQSDDITILHFVYKGLEK